MFLKKNYGLGAAGRKGLPGPCPWIKQGESEGLIMAILAQCPICRRRQSAKNKKCKCGENLDKAKKGKKVRYWIDYPLPNGKVRGNLSEGLRV